MIYSITFVGEEQYGVTPEKEMQDWCKGWDREEIISAQKNADGSITVFYWWI